VPVFTAIPHQPFEGALAHDTVAVADLVRHIAPDRGAPLGQPGRPRTPLAGRTSGDSLDAYVWRLGYKWAKFSHANKSKRWVTDRYFGMFNPFRQDR
jgi:hypothetical protein